MCDRANGGEPRFPGLSCIVNTYRNPKNFAASWRWNPGSTVVNEFVVGMNRFAFDFQIPTNDASKPTLSFGSITMPETYYFGNARKLNTWQFVDNLSWATGSHSLKFGMNLRFGRHTDVRGSIAGYNAGPYIDFSTGVNTVDPATFGIPSTINTTYDRPTLQSHINFLLGRVGSLSQGFVSDGTSWAKGGTLFEFDARYPELDFFAQDTWRPRRNITVDLGLRWELKMTTGNPQGLVRRPGVRVAAGEPPTSSLKWDEGDLYKNDIDNLAPSIGIAWDPEGDGKSVIRGNYRVAYDRINTFVLSSAIFQSIPGITAGVVNTAYGTAGGRLQNAAPVVAALQPTFTPESYLQPPAVSSSSMRVVDNTFDAPLTHGWALSYQREILKNTLLEVAYVGRRASHLFGGYNANQVEIFSNGFVDAFKTVQGGGQSTLMNQLLAPDTRRSATETGSDMVRRLYLASLQTNNVAGLASALATRVQSNRTLADLSGLGSVLLPSLPAVPGRHDRHRLPRLLAVPQPPGEVGSAVHRGDVLDRLHAVEIAGHPFVRSGVHRGRHSQLPVGIEHAVQHLRIGRSTSLRRTSTADMCCSSPRSVELPFGRGKRFASDASPVVDRLVAGWELAGVFTWQTGRPFTVYSGNYRSSNIVQTPANCTGCSRTMGRPYNDATTGLKWFFDEADRAKFSTPAPGEFGNVGRNYFIGPSGLNLNMTLAKRVRTVGNQSLEVRLEATNVTNTPTFGFPTATLTSTTFGRIYNTVVSGSRKAQLGIKYSF